MSGQQTQPAWVEILHQEWDKIAPEPLYADPETDLGPWFDAAVAMLEGEHWNHYDDSPEAYGLDEIYRDEAARRTAQAYYLLNYGGRVERTPESLS